jgi:hypothetical protein
MTKNCIGAYFGQFFHKLISDYESIMTKTVLGHILGDFFTNSSGRPVSNQEMMLQG